MATFEGGQKQGSAFTTAEINRLKLEVLNTYRDAIKDINKEIAVWYAKYLTGKDPKAFYNIMIQGNKLTEMQNNISALYTKASLRAGEITKASSTMAFTNEFYRNQYLSSWFAPVAGVNLSFSQVNPFLANVTAFGTEQVWDTILKKADDKIAETTKEFNRLVKAMEKDYGDISIYNPKAGTLTKLLVDNRKEELALLRKTIARDLLLGKPYGKTAASVNKIIGTEMVKTVKGVKKVVIGGAKAEALAIVRTEGNRNLNAGSYAYTKYIDTNTDLKMKRRLLAVLDIRTRAQSSSMDGQTVGVDEPFTYPDGNTSFYPGNSGNPAYDVNDRETVIDLIEGVDPQLRRGRNPVKASNWDSATKAEKAAGELSDGTKIFKPSQQNEVFTYKDFDTWAADNNLKRNKSGKLVVVK